VNHDHNGILVAAGDAVVLAQALRDLGTDGALQARLVSAGNQRAEELSMRKLALRYLEIYRDVLTAEAEARIVVQPSAAVRYFEDRLLRRPRLVKLSQAVRESVTETMSDTMASLRDRTANLRERVVGDRTVERSDTDEHAAERAAPDEHTIEGASPEEPPRER